MMDLTQKCFCGSDLNFKSCCERFIKGSQKASTAEELMRSRYSAYVLCDAKYLIQTTHPSKRALYTIKDIEDWSLENKWLRLQVLKASQKKVEFKAYYLDANLQDQVHHELSTFEYLNGFWYYLEGRY